MTTKSLPPYDEFEDSALPTYVGPAKSSRNEGLLLPDTIEIHRTKFPHYLITSPTDSASITKNALSTVRLTLSTLTKGISSTPEALVKVHLSGDESSEVVGETRVTNSHSTNITLHPSGQSNGESGTAPGHVKFNQPGSSKTSGFTFEFAKDGKVVDTFEWVDSGSDDAKSLAKSNIGAEDFSKSVKGLILISTSTKATLAVFVSGASDKTSNPRTISGKIRFAPMAQGHSQDENERTWRLLVVLSVLSMLERTRMSQNKYAKFGAKFVETFFTLTAAS